MQHSLISENGNGNPAGEIPAGKRARPKNKWAKTKKSQDCFNRPNKAGSCTDLQSAL